MDNNSRILSTQNELLASLFEQAEITDMERHKLLAQNANELEGLMKSLDALRQ